MPKNTTEFKVGQSVRYRNTTAVIHAINPEDKGYEYTLRITSKTGMGSGCRVSEKWIKPLKGVSNA